MKYPREEPEYLPYLSKAAFSGKVFIIRQV